MTKPRLVSILALLFVAGCTHTKTTPSPLSPPEAPPAAPISVPPSTETIVPPQSSAPSADVDTKPAAAPADVAQSPIRSKPAAARHVKPKAPSPATVVAAAPAPVAPAALAAKPPLDFKSLVERLRGTSAIGVFTKLSVKNQVDDLLDAFRGYYAGKVPPTLDELHERYDGLVLKVVTLVQDGDVSLASAISASRSAIWARLSNRESFQEIS